MALDPQLVSLDKSLDAFSHLSLREAGRGFFSALDYSSALKVDLRDTAEFLATFDPDETLDRATALCAQWTDAQVLYQITDDDVIRVAGQTAIPFRSYGKVHESVIESYLLLAIDLKPRSEVNGRSSDYSRTQLADATRAINRLFPMPALVLFRHGPTANRLSLAIIRRRLNRRDQTRDVLESQVTLFKDIPLDEPHRPQLEILRAFSLTRLVADFRCHNFVGLHAAWEERLGTYRLDEHFYTDIAQWFFWAVKHPDFTPPRDVQNSDPDRDHEQRSIFLIRLLTRLIFCWFLRQKGLIPHDLFREAALPELIKDTSAKAGTYYRAILQNLFFATLNQEMGERGFRKKYEGNRDGNRGVSTLYRYEKLLRDPSAFEALLSTVPFLNGGLFECLDDVYTAAEKKAYGTTDRRMDDFSEERDNLLNLPNELFFGRQIPADISWAFKDRESTEVVVDGLVHIFDRYPFTIDEDTPLDQAVALNPDLLGHVFENLLASYNEDTNTVARKAKGTFYTPRAIVDYMVNESLLTYFEERLSASGLRRANLRADLEALFVARPAGYSSPFSSPETSALIAAIDGVKILDPACGSGAYPMGALQRLVNLLSKLDPKNVRWKRQRLAAARLDLDLARSMHDDQLRDSAIEEARTRIADIESSFDTEFHELDYARKLYLIENCIYAIDKEPIATQITKLRFFITLIVDQKLPADPSALDNRGIRSLPNLETKIVAADSLLPPYADAQQLDGRRQNFLFEKELDNLREDLLALRHDIMLARGKTRKARLRLAYRDKRREIADLLKDAGFGGDASERLAGWDPFDQNTSTPFFEPEWMFGVPVRTVHLDSSTPATLRGNFALLNETSGQMELPAEGTSIESGFDIVVANPPYVRQETIKAFTSLHAGPPAIPYKDALKTHYECFSGTADLYVYFYERALRLVRPGGVISFITSNKYYRAGYGAKLRPWLARESRILEMIDFGDAPVFTAIAYPTIIFAQRHLDGPRPPDSHEIRAFNWDPTRHRPADIPRFAEMVRAESFTMPQNALAPDGWRLGGSAERKLLERLRMSGPTLGDHCHGRLYRGVLTGLNEAFVIAKPVRDDLIKADPKSAEIIKPFLRGRDIKRWRCEPVELWLIFTRRGIDISRYPAIRDYLKGFKKALTPGGPGGRKAGSYEWYEIQDNIAYYEEFDQPKIIVPAITDTVNYAPDYEGYYTNNKATIVVPDSVPYVLGILNSSVAFWFARQVCASKQGGFWDFEPRYSSQTPIPRATPEQQVLIEQLVNHLIWLHAHPATTAEDILQAGPMIGTFEKLVEAMVYELFFEPELHAARLCFFKLVEESDVPPAGGGKSVASHRERLTAYFQRVSSLNHPLREALFALPSLEIARLIEPAAI